MDCGLHADCGTHRDDVCESLQLVDVVGRRPSPLRQLLQVERQVRLKTHGGGGVRVRCNSRVRLKHGRVQCQMQLEGPSQTQGD